MTHLFFSFVHYFIMLCNQIYSKRSIIKDDDHNPFFRLSMASSSNNSSSSLPEFSTLSLYKVKSNTSSSSSNQNQRRKDILNRQKEKRDSIVSQLRLSSLNTKEEEEEVNTHWPPRHHSKVKCPIGMMLAEWLESPPEDFSSWFVIPCPIGQRCLVVVQSHQTQIFNKFGSFLRTISTHLPRKTILFCIYDSRSMIYFIIDVLMWNGQDYSTQMECQCRFFMLMSLEGDQRLKDSFVILPRWQINEIKEFPEGEDGYLFYHPLGFYESDYSPLVCWLKPFMIEEIVEMKLSSVVEKPCDYSTAQNYIVEEQINRKEQSMIRKCPRRKNKKKSEFIPMDE